MQDSTKETSLKMKGATSFKYEIEPFDGKSNYNVWLSCVKDVLVHQGLGKVLKGEKPAAVKAEEWEDMEERAVATIRLALSPEIKVQVLDETSTAGLLKKLEAVYQSKSPTQRIFLKMELYSLKMQEGDDLVKHINEFNKVRAALKCVDEEVKEEDLAVFLLMSLPGSFQPLRVTLATSHATLKLDAVISAIMDSCRMSESVPNHSTGASFYVGESGRGQSSSQGGSKDPRGIMCYRCKQYGHKQFRCPQNPKKKGKKGSAYVADEATETSDGGELLMVSSASSNGVGAKSMAEWYLDSGCTFHVCSKRELFDTYTPASGSVVTGNNAECKVTGKGTVKIWIAEGKMCRLEGVRHVPQVSKNLISVGALDSCGYKVLVQNGIMKVCDGPKIVMKGHRKDNLYRLGRSTTHERFAFKVEPRGRSTWGTKERLSHRGKSEFGQGRWVWRKKEAQVLSSRVNSGLEQNLPEKSKSDLGLGGLM